jgi:hypothetical protein
MTIERMFLNACVFDSVELIVQRSSIDLNTIHIYKFIRPGEHPLPLQDQQKDHHASQ